MELEKRIQKARTALILDHPFIGSIAMNMAIEITDAVPTAATNGERVMFNPDFCGRLNDDQLLFLVGHECMHPMLEHCFRRAGRDPLLWNVAGDFVINQLLVDDRVGSLIEGALLDKELFDKCDGVTDRIYNELEKRQPPPPPDEGNGEPGDQQGDGGKPQFPADGQPCNQPGQYQPLDECQDAEGDPSELEQKQAEWKVKVAQAAQAAKMMGKLSESAKRLVDEVLNPKVDWREVLRDFVVKCRNDSRSWARFNRRFVAQGLYMPSVSGEAMGELVVAIDCSGSIGDKELSQFAAEIGVIKDDVPPTTLHVVYFDSRVCHHDEFSREEELVVEPHGGGGTAFAPIFEFVNEQGIEPTCCVVLTDMCCSDYGDAPGYPVLWVSTEQNRYCDDVPFGTVTVMQ